MATIINNPGTRDADSGGAGWVVAVVAILLILLIAYFGFSRLSGRSAAPTANVNVSLPSGGGSAVGSGGTGAAQ